METKKDKFRMERTPPELWREMDRLFTFLYWIEFRMKGMGLRGDMPHTQKPQGFSVLLLESMGFFTTLFGGSVAMLLERGITLGILERFVPYLAHVKGENGKLTSTDRTPNSLSKQARRKSASLTSGLLPPLAAYTFTPHGICTVRIVDDDIAEFPFLESVAALRAKPWVEQALLALSTHICLVDSDCDHIVQPNLRNIVPASEAHWFTQTLIELGVLALMYENERSCRYVFQVVRPWLREVLVAVKDPFYRPGQVQTHLPMAADLYYHSWRGAQYQFRRNDVDEESDSVSSVRCNAATYRAFLEWLADRESAVLDCATLLPLEDDHPPLRDPFLAWAILKDVYAVGLITVDIVTEVVDEEERQCARISVKEELFALVLGSMRELSLLEDAVSSLLHRYALPIDADDSLGSNSGGERWKLPMPSGYRKNSRRGVQSRLNTEVPEVPQVPRRRGKKGFRLSDRNLVSLQEIEKQPQVRPRPPVHPIGSAWKRNIRPKPVVQPQPRLQPAVQPKPPTQPRLQIPPVPEIVAPVVQNAPAISIVQVEELRALLVERQTRIKDLPGLPSESVVRWIETQYSSAFIAA